jgi:serine/threonine-protein kinase
VYRAVDRTTGAGVAIKVLRASLTENFKLHQRLVQEFRAASQLEHPNVVRALDIGTDGTISYLVFELIDGISLMDRVTRLGPLPEGEAVGIITQVAQALHYAHLRSVVHRDVKPDNILLLPDGRAKLTDFGLAKDYNDDQGLTMATSGLGTPSFMAPEQFAAAKTADARCDVYSLGATLYTAVTGQLAYTEKTPLAVLTRKLSGDPPSARAVVPGLGRRVDDAIRAALQGDPDRRPQTCLEFFKLLTARSRFDDGTGEHPVGTPTGNDRRAAVRHTIGVGACGAVDPSAIAGVRRAPEEWPLVVRDVSAGGAGVLLARRFEPGTELQIELPADEAAPRRFTARVVRVEPRAAGHWAHGCVFPEPLRDEDIRALLRFT